MNRQQEEMLSALNDISLTTDILLEALSSSDADKSNEAICVMLMQGVELFGPQSTAMKQFFPVWDAIKSHIDKSNLPRALGQATTWKTQLHEVLSLVRQG